MTYYLQIDFKIVIQVTTSSPNRQIRTYWKVQGMDLPA